MHAYLSKNLFKSLSEDSMRLKQSEFCSYSLFSKKFLLCISVDCFSVQLQWKDHNKKKEIGTIKTETLKDIDLY